MRSSGTTPLLGFFLLSHVFVVASSTWLENATLALLERCQVTGVGGVQLFTPDASAFYGAQWTRDLSYMVQYAPNLLQQLERSSSRLLVEDAIRYTFQRQRSDGCMPDRVQADGLAVYSPGEVATPFADHAMDNGPFAVKLVVDYSNNWNDTSLFCELEPQLLKALEFVNKSQTGLAFNDPLHPNCTYGFFDTVAASGSILFVSLLLFDASVGAANLVRLTGCGKAEPYESMALGVALSVDTLFDAQTSLFLDADMANALPDVWGSAYLVSLGLSTRARRQQVMNTLASHRTLWQHGQLRHLPFPLVWEKCFDGECPSPGTYQNGAFWATPLAWTVPALLHYGHEALARSLAELAASFFELRSQGNITGILECVNTQTPSEGALAYVASATNIVPLLRLVE
uniref:Predicted protein n=1 Tax=Hordeum vulgare subsp. vulgare TaxID=112509 RepID=F2E4J9_HORVV|nr:predicted protein [Hordeum vulgare subsp. vulgare]